MKLIAGLSAGTVLVLACFVVLMLLTPVYAATCQLASWYGTESCSNPRCLTASGEVFTGRAMTAAHKTLPFGTKLRVSYRGKTVTVRVNDRGPFVKGRALDLSRAAAAELGMLGAGVATVCWAPA